MDDASIRDFNGGIGCHVALALEQTLLLPKDMVELRGVKFSFTLKCFWAWYVYILPSCFSFSFLSFFFFFYLTQQSFLLFLFKTVQSTFRLEEMSDSLSQQLEEERKRRAAVVQTMTIAENSNTDFKKRLTAEEQARKSSDAAL